MDRREFVESCTNGLACLSAALTLPAIASDAKPRNYERVLLTDVRGYPLRASQLKTQTNYIFHYPFVATPVFLLDLGAPTLPQQLSTKHQGSYLWPGGVGPKRSIVAFSAICAHQLVYPTQQLSFISFRKSKSSKGVADNLIHCCAEHSQYDPAKGAKVQSGPAEQPLCAVLLEHEASSDTLTAYATLGGELFDAFFKKYEFKLGLEVGPKSRDTVVAKSAVHPLDKFCRNTVQC